MGPLFPGADAPNLFRGLGRCCSLKESCDINGGKCLPLQLFRGPFLLLIGKRREIIDYISGGGGHQSVRGRITDPGGPARLLRCVSLGCALSIQAASSYRHNQPPARRIGPKLDGLNGGGAPQRGPFRMQRLLAACLPPSLCLFHLLCVYVMCVCVFMCVFVWVFVSFVLDVCLRDSNKHNANVVLLFKYLNNLEKTNAAPPPPPPQPPHVY